MKFSEFIVRSDSAKLIDVVPLLQQIYVDAHNWNVDDSVYKVFNSKEAYVIYNLLINNIKSEDISGSLEYDYNYDSNGSPVEDQETGEYPKYVQLDRSSVNIKSLIEFLVRDLKDLALIPDDLLDAAGIERPKKPVTPVQGKSDPGVNKELGELRNEKEKWDASIEAATKIGMLFYESDLDEQPTKEAFTKEFSKQLGMGLPESTIEKIYKALPLKHKQPGGRPKKDGAAINLDSVIKAAAFAGTLHEAHERLKLVSLTNELKDIGITPPDDVTLRKIIDAVKSLDI